jgi:hypothetical protein
MPADLAITPQAQLGLAVLRNAQARVVQDLPNRMILELDVVYARWLGPLPRLLKAKRKRQVALEGLALAVWRRIDDRATLGEHIDWLVADQQLAFNEARLLTLQFLRNLSQQGLVVLGDRTVVT